ncbi:hypothetical protein OG730_03190 [Streptomyces sp. NBC_01298]|uniref:hypothetical protein n=1 Tax=Streptomyces sp. NBC_01298 TaxID=2903817 RepID=UPI002E134891|nr:hypothetical protein OG730_03190 [Streptomyces sp. NBC_01298]
MSRSMSAAGAAVVLAGLITAAAPASAAPAAHSAAAPTGTPTAASAAACVPDVVKLPSLPSGPWTSGVVNGLGADGLAVGESLGLPAYWTADHAVHAVPLPAGFQNGRVTAVNAKGLMVGTVERSSDRARAAFTYRPGDTAMRLLTGAATATDAADVNDAGRVVGMDGGTPKEWANGTVVRELPVPEDAHPSTRIVAVDGINKRGDVLGTAHTEYEDLENDRIISKTFPVVWPAGGAYPPYSLPVWNETDWTTGTQASGIDDKGRVVGFEAESYREFRRRTPAVWKKPYDAPPAAPGLVTGYETLTFEAISPATNVTVGTAASFVEGYARYVQAAYWPGTGAPLVLPNPAGASADVNTEAHAVSDDDRVGGSFRDLTVLADNPIVWTCASKQAYAPTK